MTMVCESGQVNSARTGTREACGRAGRPRRARAGRRWLASSSTVRSLNAYGCSQAPCHGSSRFCDDVARLAGGRQRDDRRRASPRAAAGWRAPVGRSASTPSSTSPSTHPEQDAVVVGGVRCASPAGPRASSGIPCHRQRTVPSTTSQASRRAPRCGQAPGPARADPSSSRQSTTSRPATVRSRVRPTGHVGGGGGDEPAVGRAAQRGAQGGLDAGGLGLAPGAAQVVGRRLGEVAHRHAVAHLLAPGPVGAQQAHAATLTPCGGGTRSFDGATVSRAARQGCGGTAS